MIIKTVIYLTIQIYLKIINSYYLYTICKLLYFFFIFIQNFIVLNFIIEYILLFIIIKIHYKKIII